MHIHGVFLHLPDSLDYLDYTRYLSLVSSHRTRRIDQLCFAQDKLVSLMTGLLIRVCIAEHTGMQPPSYSFCYGIHGKPYVSGLKHFHFSVSHSGNMIFLACAESEIGVDIEVYRRDDDTFLQMAPLCCTPEELQTLYGASDISERFLWLWTRKEAYVKYLGDGLFCLPESFSVLSQEGFLTCHAAGTVCTVCTGRTDSDVSLSMHTMLVEELLGAAERMLTCCDE